MSAVKESAWCVGIGTTFHGQVKNSGECEFVASCYARRSIGDIVQTQDDEFARFPTEAQAWTWIEQTASLRGFEGYTRD